MKKEKFHALTLEEWLENARKLTKAQLQTYYYCLLLNPFGDGEIELAIRTSSKKVGISKSALSDALAALEKLQYLTVDRSTTPVKVRCLRLSPLISGNSAPSALPNGTQIPCPAERTDVPLNGQVSGEENNSSVTTNSLSVSADTPMYIDRARDQTNIQERPPSDRLGEVKNFRATSNGKSPATLQFPEGPWLVEGKLDFAFREAIARSWESRYEGNLNDMRLRVLQHLTKFPEKLPIYWEWHVAEARDRLEKAHTLCLSGVTLEPEYEQRLAGISRALVAKPVASPVSKPCLRPPRKALKPPEEPIANPASARLRLFNTWLQSDRPKLRAKALAEAQTNPNYQLETDPEGQPLRIVEVTP